MRRRPPRSTRTDTLFPYPTLFRSAVRGEAARIMRRTDPDAIDEERALRDLGLDSLMSVELRNALVAKLDCKLPATLLFDHPSVSALARFVAAEALPHLFAKGRRPAARSDRRPVGKECVSTGWTGWAR